MPTWGIAASPLVEGGLVIVQIGGADDACLAAFDKAWHEVIAEESKANPNFKRVYDSYAKFRSDYAIWRDHGYVK